MITERTTLLQQIIISAINMCILLSWFFLLQFFIFGNSADCPPSFLSRPKVNLTARLIENDGNGDFDIENDTTLIVSNNFAKVDLICKAFYPIEWIVHYHENEDGGGMIKNAFVNRNFTNFFNTSTYEYTATLKFRTERICNSVNFSCQSTLEPRKECWTTAVSMEIPENTEFVRNILIFKIKQNTYFQPSPIPSSQCKATAYYYNLTVEGSVSPCWQCYKNVNTGNNDLQFIPEDFHSCSTAMHCNNYFGAANKGTQCLNLEYHNFSINQSYDFYRTKECAGDVPSAKLYGGRFITCKSFGLLLAQHFIVSLPTEGKTQTYFRWSDIIPDTMIGIDVDRPSVFVGEEFVVECTFSRYYFSYGCQLAVQFVNGTLQLFTDAAVLKETGYSMTLSSKIKATTSMMTSVICIGAVWNTTDWTNKSSSIFIRDDTLKPSISEETTNEEYYLGDRNKTLRCSGEGRPIPTLKWISTPLKNLDIHQSIGYTEIRFQEMSHSHQGTYICEAENILGKYIRRIEVTINDSKNRTVGIVICLFVVAVLIFLIVGFIFWKKIKYQDDLIRSLTELEVIEFLEGNKTKLFATETDYLNTPDKIGCLGYNQNYEIPRQKLKFEENHKLGEGAYGMVYKGFLKSDENLSTLKSDVVAIKTVCSTVTVEHFKTLLSEIKVLIYIGPHKNIVSLKGACTENIKNRDVLIALEYCEQGDLLNFLSSSRNTFQDLFCDPITGLNKYENISVSGNAHNMTSRDLLKWTINIADGLEYLAEKRVIHGDVAARNVLLNANLEAKIGDFGLSRQLLEFSNYVKTTRMPLPFKWMALESLKRLEFSIQSDVWAFGVTLWEIYSLGEVPFAGCNYSTDFIEQLSGGMRMGKPKACPDDIYLYIVKTWNPIAKERPLYTEIRSICQRRLGELEEFRRNNPVRRVMMNQHCIEMDPMDDMELTFHTKGLRNDVKRAQ